MLDLARKKSLNYPMKKIFNDENKSRQDSYREERNNCLA